MSKSIKDNGSERKESIVRLESFINEGTEETGYVKLDISIPISVYKKVCEKGLFDEDFIIAFSQWKCNMQDLYNLFISADDFRANYK